jgi:hypothetical protein
MICVTAAVAVFLFDYLTVAMIRAGVVLSPAIC